TASSSSNNGTAVALASNGVGYAVVLLRHDSGSTSPQSLFVREYTAGAWGPALAVEADTPSSSRPRVSPRGSSYGITWNQSVSGRSQLRSRFLNAGALQATSQLVQGDHPGTASRPAVAVNASGAVAVWEQRDGD